MKRLIAQGALLATALMLGAALVAAPSASAHHDPGDQGPDHDWACVYVEWIQIAYCQQSPIPEPEYVFPPEILVEHFVELVNAVPGIATTIVTRAPGCLGTLDPNSRPPLGTAGVPDPLNIVPDQELVPGSGTSPLDVGYCIGL
jgi:hypothetical protein